MFSGGKINRHVKFEKTLDLSEFCSFNCGTKVTYSLFSVLVHYGYSIHGGHYVSFCKAPNDSWYLMDDSRVQSVSNFNSVLKEKAYLLFYRRNESKVCYESPYQSPSPKKSKTSSYVSSFDSLKQLASELPPISPGMKESMTTMAKKRKSASYKDPYAEWKQNSNEKKRKLGMDKGEKSSSSPIKKRKIEEPIKADKVSRKKQLRLLKQHISKRRVSLTSPQSSTSSSPPSYASYHTTLRHRHRTLLGRRSNSLKLAAKTSLNTSTLAKENRWNRRQQSTQIPSFQNLQKLKQ